MWEDFCFCLLWRIDKVRETARKMPGKIQRNLNKSKEIIFKAENHSLDQSLIECSIFSLSLSHPLHTASVPLGSYTPIKATIFNSNYELGITRTTTPPSTTISSPAPVKYQAPPPPPPPRSKHSTLTNGTSTNGISKRPPPPQPPSHLSPAIDQLHKDTNGTTNGMDTDSLQYLKPASDEQTVAWSEGASDLLFWVVGWGEEEMNKHCRIGWNEKKI